MDGVTILGGLLTDFHAVVQGGRGEGLEGFGLLAFQHSQAHHFKYTSKSA